MVGQNHSKAGTGYVNSGSGLRILEYWAQILDAYFITNHNCATLVYRALSG